MSKRHLIIPPADTADTRADFLKRTAEIGELLAHLRIEKMKVYGMSWMKRGWDSLFQNIDRKFSVIEENIWEKLVQQRLKLSDEEFVALADGLTDLANYAVFGRWLLEYVYPDRYLELKERIQAKTEVLPEDDGMELSSTKQGDKNEAD
jgi:hypothetical protein